MFFHDYIQVTCFGQEYQRSDTVAFQECPIRLMVSVICLITENVNFEPLAKAL